MDRLVFCDNIATEETEEAVSDSIDDLGTMSNYTTSAKMRGCLLSYSTLAKESQLSSPVLVKRQHSGLYTAKRTTDVTTRAAGI
jgi:hypothetical protein